jgi:hypothetical protein
MSDVKEYMFYDYTKLEFLTAEALVSRIILEHNMQVEVYVCFPGQWSPLNVEGKKKYDQDVLLELQDEPLSRKKPENLPDLDVVMKHSRNHVSGCIVRYGSKITVVLYYAYKGSLKT